MNIGNGDLGLNKKGKLDVFINDQTNPLFHYFLINEQKTDITLTSDALKNTEVINVSPGHGFTGAAGEYLTMFYNGRYVQQIVVGVATNAIAIEYPIASDFLADGTIIYRGNNSIVVNGSVTPVDFKMTLTNLSRPIDISKIILVMTHSAAGDDGKFGGIAELTNGMWFRKENEIDFNLGNYKNNGDFKRVGADIVYSAKGPAGIESTTISFDLVSIFGQVIRMDDRLNDIFCSQVRDSNIGLSSFTISMIGSYTDEN